MQRKTVPTLLFALALLAGEAASTIGFKAELSHANALYKLGEEAVFTLTATNGAGERVTAGEISATLDDWCNHILAAEKIDLSKTNPFQLRGKLGAPGFMRMKLAGTGIEKPFLRCVGFEPERLEPGAETPGDFDRFWANAQEKLEAEVPLDPRLEYRKDRSTATFDFWRISFATVGGKRVWGFMTVPKNKALAPFPVSFEVASAGVGKWTMDFTGGAADRICVYFTVHTFEPPATVEELKVIHKNLSDDLKRKYGVGSYSAAGIGVSREEYYFYPAILGINRAVNWVWERNDVDRSRFNYKGGSQGGGFGLYLCGLNHKFTSAALNVPAITDVMGSLKGRITGFPYCVEMNRAPERKDAALRNAPYFDGANFAKRVKCPVRIAIGFIDEICPPTGIYVGYNCLGSKDKGIVHGLYRGHGYWPEAAPIHVWQEKNFFKKP